MRACACIAVGWGGATTSARGTAPAAFSALAHSPNPPAPPPPPAAPRRHQRFHSLFRSGAPYNELLSPADRAMLPRLARFQHLTAYRRQPPLEGALEGEALRSHYDALLDKYGLGGALRW